MPQAQGTEVTYRTTGDCSIELGSPKEGRMKLFFTEDEIANVNTAKAKIENMGEILDYARRRMSSGKK